MYSNEKRKTLYKGEFDIAAHNDRLNRFNSHQGHGYAAEQGNDLYDRLVGHDAQILGDDNAKNGADRLVDGKLIQTKYCQTARASIDAGFKNGVYRYIDSNGNPMQLEVPSDQYDEAVKVMAKKIQEGKVPNYDDPKKASDLVRKGNITLSQATNLAKAGTIESLTFDAVNGAVIGTSAAGISATIMFARAIWNGEDINSALDIAVFSGLQAGGIAFITSLVSAQLTKTTLNTILLKPSVELVKALPTSLRNNLLITMRSGAPIFGAAASNNLAKLLRDNLIVSAVSTLVLASNDILNYVNGKISGKQLFKEMTTIASGVLGATSGATGSTTLLTSMGLTLGPVGAAITAIVGGIIGGSVSTSVSRGLLNSFIEDDAVKLTQIINNRFSVLAHEYLLNEDEIELSIEALKACLVRGKLLDMFASSNKDNYADSLILQCINSIIVWRTTIRIPSQLRFTEGIGRVINGLENNTFNISNYKKIDSQVIARKLLNRDISDFAAQKAWYITKQFDSIGKQSEILLQNMKDDECNHLNNMGIITTRLTECKKDFEENLTLIDMQLSKHTSD